MKANTCRPTPTPKPISAPPIYTEMFIGGLHPATTERELKKALKERGRVRSLKLVTDR